MMVSNHGQSGLGNKLCESKSQWYVNWQGESVFCDEDIWLELSDELGKVRLQIVF